MDFLLWPGRVWMDFLIKAFTLFYGLYWELFYGRHVREALG